MKVYNKLTHIELLEKFKSINNSVEVISWQPLINDECIKYADTKQPMLRVDLSNNMWLRVYVDKEYNEITWY